MLNKYRYILAGLGFFLLSFGASHGARAATLEVIHAPAAFTAPAALRTAAISDRSYLPMDWQTLTSVYNYAFESAGFYDPSYPMTIKLSYDEAHNGVKQLFAFDWASRRWLPLPTKDYPEERYVTAETKATMDRIVLMARPGHMAVGNASWYRHKNGLFAASPDFAKGSVLRVTNLANGQSVEVTVNDYGPVRSLHPDRAIDLDYVAFQKIADPKAGVVKVRVEPVSVTAYLGNIVAPPAPITPVVPAPALTASSAVVYLENSGEVLWGKDEGRVAPLASLTKLVAAKVFLETKPDLKKVVTYKVQDEKYNYEHVREWESARLRVKDGDTLTIEDLLYSTLVGSANNTAETLARVSGLSRAAFIARMNDLARSWGAKDTKFVEPSGLAPANVSSALDYAIITKAVMADETIRKISSAKNYTFRTRNTDQPHTLTNTSQLVREGNYNIAGSKTGYLDEAGFCLMTRVETPQGNLIVVNFGSKSKAANFSDNASLIRYGLSVLKQ